MADALFAHRRLRPHARLIAALWVVYWLVLVGLMHWPRVSAPVAIPQQDKAAHFAAYFLLAAGWIVVWRARRPSMSFKWLWIWLVLFAGYAAIDEVTQPLTGRDTCLADWLADVGGVAVAMLFGAWMCYRDHQGMHRA
jgi:VanZ family protein